MPSRPGVSPCLAGRVKRLSGCGMGAASGTLARSVLMNRINQRVEDGGEFLTVAEVAMLDRCSEKTVRRAIAAGRLVAVRIGPGGHLVRVSRRAHEAYRRGGNY